jgi:hypothetical protein
MALAPRSEANQIASLGLNSTSGNNGLNRRNPLTGGPIQALLTGIKPAAAQICEIRVHDSPCGLYQPRHENVPTAAATMK